MDSKMRHSLMCVSLLNCVGNICLWNVQMVSGWDSPMYIYEMWNFAFVSASVVIACKYFLKKEKV